MLRRIRVRVVKKCFRVHFRQQITLHIDILHPIFSFLILLSVMNSSHREEYTWFGFVTDTYLVVVILQ